MSTLQSHMRRTGAGAAVAALLALAGCSTPPSGGTTTPSGSGTTSPAAAMPSTVYTDQQLADVAAAVVQSRTIQGMVRDPQSLRGNLAMQGTAVSSTTTPNECSPFRLHEDTDTQLRYLDTGANVAAGQIPFTSQDSPTITVEFAIRSAARDKLAKADFDYTDALVAKCAQFERTYTDSHGGQSPPGTAYTAQLVTAPAVGEKSYGTTQKAKGLGAQDMGIGGMQVLAGTLAIDMSTTLWPVTSVTTSRAMDAMAGFARGVIGQALTGGASPTAPSGALPSDQLAGLLKNATGPAGATFYLNPTVSRVVTRMAGATSAPTPGHYAFDDASYYAALAGNATMAQGIGSTDDKMIMSDLTVISTSPSNKQPYPFDARAAALTDCSSIQANIQGQGPTTWPSATPITAKLDADSSYAFKYSLPDGQFHWYIRIGARRGNLTVEISTFAGRALADESVQPAIDTAAAVIDQMFTRAGLQPGR